MQMRSSVICASLLALAALTVAVAAYPKDASSIAPVLGTWRISSRNHCPNVCALDDAQARRLTGTVLRYSTALASNGTVACASPRFVHRALTEREFYDAYRFPPEVLGLAARPIEEISVECSASGTDWWGLGTILLVKDRHTVYALLEGVFFEARRE